MSAEEGYQIWITKNQEKIKNIKDFLEIIKSAYVSGYYDGLETQETKTAEYNWNKWNQK